ncbi:MAG TPA: type II toxin-antitoxin system PemK/MazF family toxin [Bacteroides sp.]|nr:type II toxin-antitoxin system PemK/MazF family toxin [Bacteroides sp.]
MEIKQFDIWIADLNPRIGTEAGKTRPVIVVQTNLLNCIPHPSSIVCPITSNIALKSDLLRVHLKKGMANLHQDCDILIDQLRVIDNRRLVKKVGMMPVSLVDKIKENLRIVLDIE